jgi:hypothetical protein
MKVTTEQWVKSLVAAFVTGAASSLLSSLGISGAQVVGINITQLNLKQLGVITLAGGVVGAAAYLKQSPVPPES